MKRRYVTKQIRDIAPHCTAVFMDWQDGKAGIEVQVKPGFGDRYHGEPPIAARHLLHRANANGWTVKEFSPIQHSGTFAMVRLHKDGVK